MGETELDRFDASIVVVGATNPAIVTPDWLWRKDLISESDKDACNETLQAHTAEGVIAYHCDWFQANVVHQKLSVTTNKGSTPRIRDLVVGIFASLPETPVTMLGINFQGEYKIRDVQDYYLLGDVFAPKTIWEAIYPKDKYYVGTMKVVMQISDGARPVGFPTGAPKNYRQVSIETSARGRNFVQFSVNNHFDLPENSTGKELAPFLVEKWEPQESECRDLMSKLVNASLERHA